MTQAGGKTSGHGTQKRRAAGYLAVAAVTAGILGGTAYLLSSKQAEMLASTEANEMETAYLEVSMSHVAVNGPMGTEKWRAYYAKGLSRLLDSYDFDQACAYNGFLREAPSDHTFGCIAANDIRAVRTTDGAISYFREQSGIEKVVRLDVLQQDVHASDYLDIDTFVTAVRDRATQAKTEVPIGRIGAAAEKPSEEFVPVVIDPIVGSENVRSTLTE